MLAVAVVGARLQGAERKKWIIPAIVGVLVLVVFLVMLSGSSASEKALVDLNAPPQQQPGSRGTVQQPVNLLAPIPPTRKPTRTPSPAPTVSVAPQLPTAAELAASVVPQCSPSSGREWRVTGVTPWFGGQSHPWARGSITCPNGCRIAWAHDGNVEGADILLYHASDLDHHHMDMPRSSSKPHQRRALLASETFKLASYDDAWFKRFNSEMSFRPRSFVRDTYIYWMFTRGQPVGGTFTGKLATSRNFTDVFGLPIPTAQRRTDLFITWASSHCGSKSGREEYVRELLKHVMVTIVGGTCLANAPDDIAKLGIVEQWAQFRKFKFNLSFENHRCDGYVTEKLYLAFLLGQVPVVMGAPNIADHAPPNSYIDASLYTPKELAEYLTFLNQNDEAYDAFHAWRAMSFDTYGVHMKREFLEVLRLVDDPRGAEEHMWQSCITCNALECEAQRPSLDVLEDGIPAYRDSCRPQWTPAPEPNATEGTRS